MSLTAYKKKNTSLPLLMLRLHAIRNRIQELYKYIETQPLQCIATLLLRSLPIAITVTLNHQGR